MDGNKVCKQMHDSAEAEWRECNERRRMIDLFIFKQTFSSFFLLLFFFWGGGGGGED